MVNNKFNFWIVILVLFYNIAFAENKNIINTPSEDCTYPRDKQNFYIGIAAGYDNFALKDKINYLNEEVTAFNLDPVLNTAGITGGIFLGYKKIIPQFFNTLLGLEFFLNGSGANALYQLNLNNSIDIYTTNINVKSTYGINALPGIVINKDALFYIRLGYSWVKMDVNEINTSYLTLPFEINKTAITEGFNYGLGFEYSIYQNINLRLEYNQTHYHTFKTQAGTEIEGTNNQFMAGFIYHFPFLPFQKITRLIGWR